MPKENNRPSLQTSLLHSSPQTRRIRIVLDKNGYTKIDELINKLNAHNVNINFQILFTTK